MELHPFKEHLARVDEAFQAEGKMDSSVVAAAGSVGTAASDQCDEMALGTVQGDAVAALGSKIRSLDSHVQSQTELYQAQAKKLVDSQVKLLVEPEDESELMSALLATIPMDILGDRAQKTHVLLHYDVFQASESATQAKWRVPGLRGAHYKKVLGTVLRARLTALRGRDQGGGSDGDEEDTNDGSLRLISQDVCCIYDGQKVGRDHGINSVFIDSNKKHIKKCERALHLSFCQDGCPCVCLTSSFNGPTLASVIKPCFVSV